MVLAESRPACRRRGHSGEIAGAGVMEGRAVWRDLRLQRRCSHCSRGHLAQKEEAKAWYLILTVLSPNSLKFRQEPAVKSTV